MKMSAHGSVSHHFFRAVWRFALVLTYSDILFCSRSPCASSRRITIASDFISIEQAIIINITKCHFQEAFASPSLWYLLIYMCSGCSLCFTNTSAHKQFTFVGMSVCHSSAVSNVNKSSKDWKITHSHTHTHTPSSTIATDLCVHFNQIFHLIAVHFFYENIFVHFTFYLVRNANTESRNRNKRGEGKENHFPAIKKLNWYGAFE